MSVASLRALGVGLALLEQVGAIGRVEIRTEPVEDWRLSLTAAGEAALAQSKTANGVPGMVPPSAALLECPTGGHAESTALERALAAGGLTADGPPCQKCGAPMDYAPAFAFRNARGELVHCAAAWGCAGCGCSREA